METRRVLHLDRDNGRIHRAGRLVVLGAFHPPCVAVQWELVMKDRWAPSLALNPSVQRNWLKLI
ncbi:MAG: hypothetical protein H0X69_13085 [Gemmatimonadales bacterium]|nr:hypothetical protein [Gemmatimonadales bacterium]